MKFFEGSAKDGTGIAEAFQELAQLILHAQQVRRLSQNDQPSANDIINLDAIPVYQKQQRKCCGNGGTVSFS